jgi:hypothetical protein
MRAPRPFSFWPSAWAARFIWFSIFILSAGLGIIIFESWPGRLAACLTSVGLAGAALLRAERWRAGSLVVASTSAAVVGLTAIGEWLVPAAENRSLTRTAVPTRWIEPDPVTGYRLIPTTTILVTAAVAGQTIYRATYTIGADGNRVTPPAPDGADTYIFVGDSFVFGEGLAERETLPAQFARAAKFDVATANLAVPSYGPNHVLRMLEAGRLARFRAKHVKAVVTWIIPHHLERVVGEAPWLGESPAYILDDGDRLGFVGTFNEQRRRHPVDAVAYWLRQKIDFLKPVGARQRQAHSSDLFVAIMTQIRDEVERQFRSRFIVLYSWPDGQSATQLDDPLLVEILGKLRERQIELMSVNRLMIGLHPDNVQIPHDGHPTATLNHLVAEALKRRLLGDGTER